MGQYTIYMYKWVIKTKGAYDIGLDTLPLLHSYSWL